MEPAQILLRERRPLETPPSETPASLPQHTWTPLTRLAFRIAFFYFLCFLSLSDTTLLNLIPVAGGWISEVITWPSVQLTLWIGHHIFHLTGIAAVPHETGSGDTALDWIQASLFILFALLGGLLWTAIATLRGSRRTQYQTLYAWLRFLLRLYLAMQMFDYGLDKLFPSQMAPISIAILNETVGQTSPMTLLWSLIGLNPIYESICGAAEILGGVLFLFRRTALLGALLSAFVLTNVVLYNFFFDVPVKLFAANLLLASLFVVLPDVPALYRFFWLHQPAAPCGVWVPPASRKAFRVATRTVEIIFVVFFVAVLPSLTFMGWNDNRAAANAQSPLLGAWHLDPIHPATGSFLTPEGLPASDLYIDTPVRAFTRSTDGVLWRTELEPNFAQHTLQVSLWTRPRITYSWQMPDPNHLTLTSLPPEKPDPKARPFTPDTLTFTRTPIPSHYPLLDRGFHFINEWGLER
jgi:hypothetical protein